MIGTGILCKSLGPIEPLWRGLEHAGLVADGNVPEQVGARKGVIVPQGIGVNYGYGL